MVYSVVIAIAGIYSLYLKIYVGFIKKGFLMGNTTGFF